MRQKLLFLALVLLLAGCSDPKIDASSDEAMEKSVEEIRKDLPKDRKKAFDEALQIVALRDLDLKDLFEDGMLGTKKSTAKIREALDGKTGEEVIAEAEKVKKEREKRAKEGALQKVAELEAKKEKAEKAKKHLARFTVISARFYKQERKYLGEEPIIELTVKNGTPHAVSRAYFKGTLASPNRSVPWLVDTFNYEISGGLEPGEEATWSLVPNIFSEWGKVTIQPDAVFTVEVEQLDGPDGRPLFSAREFTKSDEKILNELLAKYYEQY